MSTDTYIDFHSEESWERWFNWRIWSGFLDDMSRDEQDNHYAPSRIGHIGIIAGEGTYDLWADFEEAFSGQAVTEEIIPYILEMWNAIYEIAKHTEIRIQSEYLDILSPSEMELILKENIGRIIYTRID